MSSSVPSIADRRARASSLAQSKSRRRRPFEVRNAAANGSSSAVMYIYGPISSWGWGESVISARSVIKALSELDVDHIDVHVHSPGGDGFEGIAILNAFRNHRATIAMHVDGLAASAASVIVQAGDEIVMGRGAQMMIHDASMLTWGNAAQLHEDADWLDKQSQNIAGVYADRAGGTPAQWRAAMKQESWYTAEEAVAAGLADRVSGKDEETDNTGETSVPGEGHDGDADLEDAWDLSIYTYAGRANAPSPLIPAASLSASGALPSGVTRVKNRAGRPEPVNKPPSASAAGSPTPVAAASGDTTQEGAADVFTNEQLTSLRQKLGVTDADADGQTLLNALDEALEEGAAGPSAAAGSPTVPEGMVLMDSTMVESLRADATAGRQARQQQQAERRQKLVKDAIGDGRITARARQAWLNKLEIEGASGEEQLASLETGLIPLTEIGYASDGEPDTPPATGKAAVDTVRNSDTYKNWSK